MATVWSDVRVLWLSGVISVMSLLWPDITRDPHETSFALPSNVDPEILKENTVRQNSHLPEAFAIRSM